MIDLATIVTAICRRAGLGFEQFDVTELEGVEIDGYVLTREMNGLGALQPLRMVGAFDIVDRGEQLRFVRRGAAPVATLTEDELGAHADGEDRGPLVTTTTIQDVELPRQIRLQYSSVARDYESGAQLSPSRIGTVGLNEVTVQCPVMLSDDQAAQIAEVLFREAWESRDSHEFTVGPDRQALEPSDVLLIPVEGRNRRVRIKTIDDQGPQLRRVVAVDDDDGAYVSTAVATPPKRPPSTVTIIAGSQAVLLDLPALFEEHNHAGFYAAAGRVGIGSWPGARLYKSVDGTTFNVVTDFAVEAVIGTVVSAPAGGDGYTWDDENEYVVDIESGSLENRTDEALYAGANAAAVGAHGRWHIFQFGTAELVSPGRYKLTRLLQGRRGTEHLIPTVQVGDTFVLISGPGVYRVPLQTSEVGVERTYRAVTAGTPVSSGTDIPFAGAAQALECFSPVYIRGERDGGNDLTISWLRRDRLSQTLRDGIPLPLSEASEAYEVDILDGSTVVRTLQVSTTEAVYTSAQQTSDFGSPQSEVDVRIYQMSDVGGRGVPAEATV